VKSESAPTVIFFRPAEIGLITSTGPLSVGVVGLTPSEGPGVVGLTPSKGPGVVGLILSAGPGVVGLILSAVWSSTDAGSSFISSCFGSIGEDLTATAV